MLSFGLPVSTNNAMPTLNASVIRLFAVLISACFSMAKAVFQFAVLSTKNRMFGRVASIVGLARKMSVSSPTGSTNCAHDAPEQASAPALRSEAESLRRIMRISARSTAGGYEGGSRAGRARGEGLYRDTLPDEGFRAREAVADADVEFPDRGAGLRVEQRGRERLAMALG